MKETNRFSIIGRNAVRVLVELYQGPRTKEDLAGTLGCSQRAVKRYIAAIEEAGVHVEVYDDGIGGPGGSLPRMYHVRTIAA